MRTSATHSSSLPKVSGASGRSEKEKDTIGFLPKLSQILEGKENINTRRQRSSTGSSIDEQTPNLRRRWAGDHPALGHRRLREKHGSLQRRAESLADLPNPSLISVLSGLTQVSSASSGSNSTITQKSYDKNPISKRKPSRDRKRIQKKRASQKIGAMESQTSTVFQYMHDGLASEQFLDGPPHGVRPQSSSPSFHASASSHDTDHGSDSSSDSQESDDESPMTSPASARMPGEPPTASTEPSTSDLADSRNQNRFRSDSGISVHEGSSESIHYASMHHHGDQEVQDEDVEEEGEQNEGEEYEGEENEGDEDEGQDDDSGQDDNESAYSDDDRDMGPSPTHHLALERTAPPRIPSASSSRHSDPHTRRLRHQEQELRNHVLQSPQPHRDFQFAIAPSSSTRPTMPLYDAYARSTVSPEHYQAQAPPPVWPPSAPPPPPIGYSSPTYAHPVPYSLATENSYVMAPHPSMAPPGSMVQQPPFCAHSQPPHYQPQPTGPDLSRTTVVGYELLADKLSGVQKNDMRGPIEGSVVPMYRKFEQLNHRILLHLQDEISEMEEELRYLDECIAQYSPTHEAGHVQPASRRGESRYGGALQYRRTDLLGRIYLKLGQYSKSCCRIFPV